jgi:hypothetical protein
MRNYIQFWHNSTGWNGKDFSGPILPIEACGDRSIIIMDGRVNLMTTIITARVECKKRGYIGFSIYRGESIREMREIRKMETIKTVY